MSRKRILIMGAAGRDFHNFNVVFRNDPETEIVAFTATQIPYIENRNYPPDLSGKLYPAGIPIYDERQLIQLIKERRVDEVVFSYSDISHEYVMHMASRVLAAGSNFSLLSGEKTMIASRKPVIAICAVRTGSGKSQTTRKVASILRNAGKRVAIVRHPMPYGNLSQQKVQRYQEYNDFVTHQCTIEEMEEYEHHINQGTVVYAGVDYEAILREAEKEADIILWDGGNNDLPFYKPNLHIVVADPHRAGHELHYHPGEINFRMADVIIINKADTASKENIETIRTNINQLNPNATVILANSPVSADKQELIQGKRCLAVEDGPTLTHGEMTFGAGVIAAKKFGASELIDPRPWVVKSISETYAKYPKIGTLLPAMGYGDAQMKDLEDTINATDCDVVIIGTPINLQKLISINKPSVRITYSLEEVGEPNLQTVLRPFLS